MGRNIFTTISITSRRHFNFSVFYILPRIDRKRLFYIFPFCVILKKKRDFYYMIRATKGV